ncbi:hypothetical protein HN51_018547 [Arachis hypogaea]
MVGVAIDFASTTASPTVAKTERERSLLFVVVIDVIERDGSLGKIPSSDHEYIVGKKDPCEVLGEGISCDGNCSDMKTNCRPFIDFLGEKDAGVPGLDDISSEVNIMKEKGKTVDDSVLVDGGEVLSAVLDGSPVHVIKKETAENLHKDAKVKRNLKKTFDEVADEELAPVFKVLKNRDS